MMGVEIKYCDTFTAAVKRMYSSNSNTVEYTKATADAVLQQPLNATVVPRWPHDTQSVLALAIKHRIHSGDYSAGSVGCSIVTSRGDERVAALAAFSRTLGRAVQSNLNAGGESYGSSITMGRFTQFADKIDVFDVMDTGNSFDGCWRKRLMGDDLPFTNSIFAIKQFLNDGFGSSWTLLVAITSKLKYSNISLCHTWCPSRVTCREHMG